MQIYAHKYTGVRTQARVLVILILDFLKKRK